MTVRKLDLTKTTYKYTVKSDGTVDYAADADGVTQNLSGCDISSTDALEAYLTDYTRAYLAGLKSEQPVIGDDITVGEQNTANAGA